MLPVLIPKGMGVEDPCFRSPVRGESLAAGRVSHGWRRPQIFETAVELVEVDVVESIPYWDAGEAEDVAVKVDRYAGNFGVHVPVGHVPLMRAHSFGEAFVDMCDLAFAVPTMKRNLHDAHDQMAIPSKRRAKCRGGTDLR